MAFEDVKTLDCDTTISLGGLNKKTGKANPTRIEGYYLGYKTVADQKKKSGVSYIHIFQTAAGNVGVWGKTNMDNKMKSVKPGLMTRVIQDGKQRTPNGDMYLYKVAVDKDNVIDVSDISANSYDGGNDGGGYEEAPTSLGGNYGGDEDVEEAELGEDETPVDEVKTSRPALGSRPAASAPDAARQAKVQAMLAGKGTRKSA